MRARAFTHTHAHARARTANNEIGTDEGFRLGLTTSSLFCYTWVMMIMMTTTVLLMTTTMVMRLKAQAVKKRKRIRRKRKRKKKSSPSDSHDTAILRRKRTGDIRDDETRTVKSGTPGVTPPPLGRALVSRRCRRGQRCRCTQLRPDSKHWYFLQVMLNVLRCRLT